MYSKVQATKSSNEICNELINEKHGKLLILEMGIENSVYKKINFCVYS